MIEFLLIWNIIDIIVLGISGSGISSRFWVTLYLMKIYMQRLGSTLKYTSNHRIGDWTNSENLVQEPDLIYLANQHSMSFQHLMNHGANGDLCNANKRIASLEELWQKAKFNFQVTSSCKGIF